MKSVSDQEIKDNSMPAAKTAVLDVRQIAKTFPGVKALDNVSLHLHEGEILGLVGENGAGKSTLMKIISGVYSPDEGELIFRGKRMNFRNSLEAARTGIGIVHQELSLLPNLTVAENIYLGREDRFLKMGFINWKKMYAEARKRLDQLELSFEPWAITSELPFSARQLIEVARVISIEDELRHKPIIILDEPTTTLSREEIERLFHIMRSLAGGGYGIIFISHRLEEVFQISQRIFVMKDGQKVGDKATHDITPAELQQMMVGRELQTEFYQESKQTVPEDEIVLSVSNLSKNGVYQDVSFNLHKGEILGLAGVQGSGIRQLARTLFGVVTPDKGCIELHGAAVNMKKPSDAITRKIGYIPEERGAEGLVLYFPLSANITLPNLKRVTKLMFLSSARENDVADRWIDELRIKTPTRKIFCNKLSGGNQQKVVIAKWLETNIEILIMDHPTRGIDVGAKEEVYNLMRRLTDKGISIILIADSLEELIGLSNNILIMKDGNLQIFMPAEPGVKPTPRDVIPYMV